MNKIILIVLILTQIVLSQTITLGESYIEINKNSIIGTQVDRVFRDLAWKNNEFEYGKVDLYDSITTENDLVPYMEGKISQLLVRYSKATIKALTPCVAKKINDEFYAIDNNLEAKYFIDPSKTEFKTALTSKNHAIFEDTHGFNMIIKPAIEMNKINKLDLVIACMDLKSKADAALYLAQSGINCYAPCDRFAYTLIGYQAKGVIIGTAPVRPTKYGAIIGKQPLTFNINDKIIVQYTDKGYPDQYCDTPHRYFTKLKENYDLPLNIISIYAGVGETYKLINKAKEENCHVIGVRLFNQKDVQPVREWLLENKNNKAVLFHTAAYNIEFFDEFPNQTTFGDLKPIIK